MTWERDNLPAHIADLRALESCPEPWCALDYELVRCKMIDVQNVRTISGKFLISALVCAEHQKSHSMRRDWEGRTNPGDWTHCPNPPLGLTRFRKEAMPEGPPLWPRTRWEVLDTEVAKTVGKSGLSCHIHGPKAIHYHRFRPEEHVHPAFAERHEPIIRLSQVSPEHRKRIEALL